MYLLLCNLRISFFIPINNITSFLVVLKNYLRQQLSSPRRGFQLCSSQSLKFIFEPSRKKPRRHKVLKPVPMASTLRWEGGCTQPADNLWNEMCVCQGDEDRGRSCLSCPTYCSVCTGRKFWLDVGCVGFFWWLFPKNWIMKILQGMWEALKGPSFVNKIQRVPLWKSCPGPDICLECNVFRYLNPDSSCRADCPSLWPKSCCWWLQYLMDIRWHCNHQQFPPVSLTCLVVFWSREIEKLESA